MGLLGDVEGFGAIRGNQGCRGVLGLAGSVGT